MRIHFLATLLVALSPALASADAVRATTIRVAPIYLSPDTSSAKLADVDRGRELIFLDTATNNTWAHVEANLTEERTVTGWMQNVGIVQANTPDGDKILFGEAVDSEDQASQRNGRRYAAQDALRLYGAVSELFPQSPLAGEAMYRSADIRWQIEKADVMSLPSAKQQDPILRRGMNEDYFKKVMKKFPNTKWAYLAAFHLIDNKLCGDWQGQSKCPAKEAEIYQNYAFGAGICHRPGRGRRRRRHNFSPIRQGSAVTDPAARTAWGTRACDALRCDRREERPGGGSGGCAQARGDRHSCQQRGHLRNRFLRCADIAAVGCNVCHQRARSISGDERVLGVLAETPRQDHQPGIIGRAAGVGDAPPLLLFESRTPHADQSHGQGSGARDRGQLRGPRDDRSGREVFVPAGHGETDSHAAEW